MWNGSTPTPGAFPPMSPSGGGDGAAVRILSTLGLQAQIGNDGATWLGGESTAQHRVPLADAGFGCEVAAARQERKLAWADLGRGRWLPDGRISPPGDLVSKLEPPR